MIRIKRVYEPATPDDGRRVLIDRLWPRGLTKAAVHADLWLKDVAPSTALRQWVHAAPEHWAAFADRYREELDQQPEGLAILRQAIDAGPVTLLYAAKDETHNNALVLKAYLEQVGPTPAAHPKTRP
jgi:uncharacterized protein YeaO (DUF488 family)